MYPISQILVDITDNEMKKMKEPRQVGRSVNKDKNAKPKVSIFYIDRQDFTMEAIKLLSKN